jgi:O-antigen ligase
VKLLADRLQWLFLLMAAIFVCCAGFAVASTNWLFACIPFIILIAYGGWLNSQFIFFCLIASLPFSFEHNFTASLGTDIPDEGLMVLVAYIFIAAVILSYPVHIKNKLRHPLLILLLILIGWTLTTTAFSQHPLISIKYLLAKGWYIGAFVIAGIYMFTNLRNISKAALLLLSAMFAVVLITLFRHALLGFHFATINQSVSPFFRNHVNYSAMLVCTIPIAAASSFLAGKKFKIAIVILTGILLVALFFSYSRGAWLALLIGILAAWLISKRKLLISYILTLFLALICLLWISSNQRYLRFAPDFNKTIFHKNFAEHWIATYELKDVSTAERFYRWTAGLRMIKDKWITGFGPNSFYDEYKPYAVPAFKTWVSNNPDHSTVHNYFLLTAVEQGLPGLVFLLLLFGAMIYYAEKIYKNSNEKFVKAIALSTGVIVTMLLVLNAVSDLVETDKIGSIFFLSIAVLVSLDKRSDLSSHIQGIS